MNGVASGYCATMPGSWCETPNVDTAVHPRATRTRAARRGSRTGVAEPPALRDADGAPAVGRRSVE